MEKDELLRQWANILWNLLELGDFDSEDMKSTSMYDKIHSTLVSVYDIGRAAGIDEEKLRIQLER